MKSFIVFTLIIAGISALPPQLTKGLLTSDERLVTGAIASAIQDVSLAIKDAGLDPVHIPHEEVSFALPVPALFSFYGRVKDCNFKGISDILITRLTFSPITLRLRLNLKLPLIEATLDNAVIKAVLFEKNINLSASGRLAVKDITVATDVRVRVGVISGVSLRSLDVAFKVGDIKSDLAVSGFGVEISPWLNHVIGDVIPNTLNKFEGDINELLEIVLFDIINDNL